MSYKFIETKKHPLEQEAYIIYMIVGSYFRKTTCKSRELEKRLHLHYLDMGDASNVEEEAKVIRETERLLGEDAELLRDLKCEVYIEKKSKGYVLDFVTGLEGIQVRVRGKGDYRLYKVRF